MFHLADTISIWFYTNYYFWRINAFHSYFMSLSILNYRNRTLVTRNGQIYLDVFIGHLYCLALWLRRLGAGLAERAAAGSATATCRSVFWRRAPRCWACPACPAGPALADVAAAERMSRGRLSQRARTRTTEVRPPPALSALPPPLTTHQLARKNQISWRRPYPFMPNGS